MCQGYWGLYTHDECLECRFDISTLPTVTILCTKVSLSVLLLTNLSRLWKGLEWIPSKALINIYYKPCYTVSLTKLVRGNAKIVFNLVMRLALNVRNYLISIMCFRRYDCHLKQKLRNEFRFMLTPYMVMVKEEPIAQKKQKRLYPEIQVDAK
ncbi:hypothetical protein FF38_05484 [Lucilia cuprina]|uniref:Uncharacterized protein n=1 Tax=Lucilia cuprina TaxID=7375 RepID=A0A0L0C5V6_LUCCU|nr:hypothetical protein FF38_05484 [Lucilia cuprina]